MAKLNTVDLTTLVNETSAVNTINNNFAAVETAMENTLSRDGTTPNQMGASLDMNSNRILNLLSPINDAEAVRKDYVDNLVQTAVGSGSGIVTLNDLSDVTIATPTTGQILFYNGTTWINDAAGAVGVLNDLTDVVLTSTTAGQYLQYNGTNWVNITEYVRDVTKSPYNADRTGVSSASIAIQAAINAGGLVYIPSGSYLIDVGLTVDNAVTIVGDGDDKTGQGTVGTKLNISGDLIDGITIRSSNVSIEKLSILGVGGTRNSTNTNGRGVVVGTALDRTVSTIAASSTISGTFTSADIGKYLRIPGAGTEGLSNYHYAYITAQAGVSATMSSPATNNTSSVTAKIGVNCFDFLLTDCTVYNHGVAVEFKSQNRCFLQYNYLLGYDTIWANNTLAIDSGDSMITHNTIAATGICLVHNSGGGLRIHDNKFVSGAQAIKMTWSDGLSGGPIITANSIENISGVVIEITGTAASDAQINGITLSANWMNGGSGGQIKISDTIKIKQLLIVGNNILNGASTSMITIGAEVDYFTISANQISGENSATNGIVINAGANHGILSNNTIHKVTTTRVSNSGTNTYVYDVGNTGEYVAPRYRSSAISAANSTAYGPENDNNTGIYFPAADSMNIALGGTPKVIATTSGILFDSLGSSATGPYSAFQIRTGVHVDTTGNRMVVSNNSGGTGVSIQGINDLNSAYRVLDFNGSLVTFSQNLSEKVRTTSTGIKVTNLVELEDAGTTSSATRPSIGSSADECIIGAGGATRIKLSNTEMYPNSSTYNLGKAGNGYGSLFMSSAAVLNFNSGNYTVTHSSGALAFSGKVSSTNATSGIGYDTGAGGTVTQITSRTTGVTINKITGSITLVSAAGSVTPSSFTVTNSAVAVTDVVIINQRSGTDKLLLLVTKVSAGSFEITDYTTGGTTVESPVINFAVIKGVTA